MNQDYEALRRVAARIQDLTGAANLLGWDQETYMPPAGIGRRAQQLGTLAALRHRLMQEELLPLLNKLATASLDDTARRNVDQLATSVHKQLRLPESFVEEQATLAAETQHTWEHAKREGSWAAFAPALARMVESKRREADYYGYTTTPYDALLDSYEPGATSALIDPVFAQLLQGLRPLIGRVAAAPQVDDGFLFRPVDEERQWQLAHTVMAATGFDSQRGRLDRSTHPFSISMHAQDVRITTIVDAHNLQAMLYSTLHELGHGLYEMGLPDEAYGLPEGEACSLSIHESQSRIWENNLGRSRAFCTWLHSQLAPVLPGSYGPAEVYRAVNKVEPSPIRILADEATYHSHILLRYDLEKALIEGTLKVDDLPAAWNARMKQDLGIDIKTEAEGALQDIHWSIGAIGYFATYTLGSLYAAQLYHHLRLAQPGLDEQLAQGHFGPAREWLQQQVHHHGRLYDSETLCRMATGEGLNPQYFLDYIAAKLTEVYNLSS